MAEQHPPHVIRRLTKELVELQSSPAEGLRVFINERDVADVQAELDGPAGTPYEGGIFRVRLSLPSDFPSSPPKGFFLTKVFHPNVANSGDICVNVLKKDWTPDTTLRHVLLVIRCLLIQPFPDSALNEEAGRLLQEDYDEYEKHARLMTSIHALPKSRTGPLTTSGANAGAVPSSKDPSQAGSKHDKGPGGSPVQKKAKPDQDKGTATGNAAKVKKSLKRL